MALIEKLVKIVYVNAQEKRVEKIILPKTNWFGKTSEFTEKQWFLHARDWNSHALVDIPQQHIVDWQPATPPLNPTVSVRPDLV